MVVYSAGHYQYTGHLLALSNCRPRAGTVPREFCSVRTPLVWAKWARYLEAHPDQDYAAYIVQGLQEGFRIGFDHQRHNCRKAKQNMVSAREKPEVVREYLGKECAEGRVLDPLDPDQYPGVHVSRFGVIPKGSTGKWRLIVDPVA